MVQRYMVIVESASTGRISRKTYARRTTAERRADKARQRRNNRVSIHPIVAKQ
jgi:hypothetical protein